MKAALALVKVSDNLRLLQQVERATGRRWVTDADRWALVDAHNRFTGRPHPRTAAVGAP